MTGHPLRVVLAATAAVLALVTIAVLGVGALVWSSARTDTRGDVAFEQPLEVPPLALSRIDGDSRRVFDLQLRSGSHEFLPGTATPTWGINQDYLGPTLRAERGEDVLVNVRNGVEEATSLHWHGMHLPARMDGGPHQLIAPGSTWSPTWTVDQPAATLWYHPHLHGSTGEHVYRGLAGMFILDDDRSGQLDLPRDYGIDDIPLMLQDKTIRDDGTLDHRSGLISPTGPLGDTVAVNGTVGPYFEVTTERVRLRLLNASSARIYDIGLDDDRVFAIVASDGGLLPEPVPADRVLLSPGERAEIVVAMAPGQTSVLRSHPADLGADFFNQRFAGGDDTLDLLQLRAVDLLRSSPQVPTQLADAPDLDLRESDSVRTRELVLNGFSINGRGMDMGRIDEVATVGDTEVWEVTNRSGTPHSFHVHDVQFRILDLEADLRRTQAAGHLRGPKDTVYLPPGTTARLLMRFTDYTDPEWPYMYHCHLLQHEDRGMMGQFVVVEPGQRAGRVPSHDDH